MGIRDLGLSVSGLYRFRVRINDYTYSDRLGLGLGLLMFNV